MTPIARWWNGSWGTGTRRDIWLEQLPDGRYRVRWRGGDWTDRDGRYITSSAWVALLVCHELLGGPGTWREISVR